MPFDPNGNFTIPNNLVSQYIAGQKKADPAPLDANYNDIALGLTQLWGKVENDIALVESELPVQATETIPGITALASQAEASAGTNDTKAMTPLKTKAVLDALAASIKTGIPGEIRLLPHRPAELPAGWYFCNGDQYPLSSAAGAALNALPANLKADFGITVSGGNISIPNMFYTDGRGYFLRGVNGVARLAGSKVDDRMRKITGSFAVRGTAQGSWTTIESPSGAFYGTSSGTTSAPSYPTQDVTGPLQASFDSSRLGANYSGTETAPLNIGMTPAIYLGE